MATNSVPIAARVSEDVARRVEVVAESPVTQYDTKSDVVAAALVETFDG